MREGEEPLTTMCPACGEDACVEVGGGWGCLACTFTLLKAGPLFEPPEPDPEPACAPGF